MIRLISLENVLCLLYIDTGTTSKSSSAKRGASFRFNFNDSSDQSTANCSTTDKISTSHNTYSSNHDKLDIKSRDNKVWTPLMLHKARVTIIKEEALIHNNSYPSMDFMDSAWKILEDKNISLSADNMRKLCASNILKNDNLRTNESSCDIDTTVPVFKETTV